MSNTIIEILAIIILAAAIIIAINGNNNINKSNKNMDKIFDEAQRDAQKYLERLNGKRDGNDNIEGELSSNQGTNQTARH